MAAPKYTVENFRVVGWNNLRVVNGTLANYPAGGIKMDLGGFVPKYVIGITAEDGLVGSFDLKTCTLKFYTANKTAATAGTEKYTMVLMGE